jgi:exopolysaccharide biosynthesis protein
MYRFLLSLLLLCGCSLASPGSLSTPTSTPPIASDVQGWQMITPGLEQRDYLPTPENSVTKLTALRIDPSRFIFRVHYRPGEPLTIREWATELPGAIAFVNANFFDPNAEILGLLVSDGVTHGASYVNRGGTFQVQNGLPRVRSNIAEPYAGEPLEQAVQGFPMLMLNGAQAYTDTAQDRFTRRTVVAQDGNGYIVLIVTPLIGLPLLDLSQYLPTTDMNLVNALNLDGGGSTLMYVNTTGTPEYVVISLDPVPAVLAVYPRS